MKKILYSVFIFQALFFSVNGFSQKNNAILKVILPGHDFNGGVNLAGYEDMIDVLSFSDGLIGCAVAGKGCVVKTSEFNFMTKLTDAVIDFRSVMLQGKTITSADLYWVKDFGEVKFRAYTIHMEDIKVSMVQESGSAGGDDLPTISIALQPTRVAWKVVTLNEAGGENKPSVFGWDFAKNLPFTYNFPAQ